MCIYVYTYTYIYIAGPNVSGTIQLRNCPPFLNLKLPPKVKRHKAAVLPARRGNPYLRRRQCCARGAEVPVVRSAKPQPHKRTSDHPERRIDRYTLTRAITVTSGGNS